MQDNLEVLTNLSKKYNPDYPIEYHFADVEYQRKFNDMKATLKMTTVFTSIAIFIACLGLLGLAMYMTEARVKEIGIRKVLGGSIINITKLLGYSSLKPILISILLFLPVSWLAMNWWLKSYAYRIQLDGWIFLSSALVIVLIASLTVGINTIRAARANPVESLRNE
jgi:ABC-type antimicrobial peptide transport system permease subunit